MLLDEGRHAGKLTQALSKGAQAEQRRRCNGQTPQSIDPAPPDADPRHDPPLRRHPMIQANAVVGVAETGAQWFGRGRLRSGGHWRSCLGLASVAKAGER
jgi:hypothetical protein